MVASISPPVLLPVLLPGSSLAPCLATCPLVTFEPLQLAASPFTVGRWDSLVLVLTGSTLLPTSVSNVGDGEDGEEGEGEAVERVFQEHPPPLASRTLLTISLAFPLTLMGAQPVLGNPHRFRGSQC